MKTLKTILVKTLAKTFTAAKWAALGLFVAVLALGCGAAPTWALVDELTGDDEDTAAA
jgi:hypothetical protein